MSESNPIELSADGKRNAYSHYCGPVGHSKNYAVCLHLMTTMERTGKLPGIYSDCEKAIDNGHCPARKMRQQERDKEQPIFFMERVRSVATVMEEGAYVGHVVSTYKRGKKGGKAQKADDRPAAPKTAAEAFLTGGGDFKDAINESMSAPKQPAAAIDHRPGESLMEMAQRIMKQNANKEANV